MERERNRIQVWMGWSRMTGGGRMGVRGVAADGGSHCMLNLEGPCYSVLCGCRLCCEKPGCNSDQSLTVVVGRGSEWWVGQRVRMKPA
jgi:hypothetical protein